MTKPSKAELLTQQIESILQGTSFELVLLEYRKEGSRWVLRLFIDHPDGVTLDHCETVTHLVSDVLDEDDVIPHAYHIEVSSPGVDRPLVKPEHFQRFVGERVFVNLVRALDGSKRITGTLRAADAESIDVVSESNGDAFHIPLSLIAKATLKPILEFE